MEDQSSGRPFGARHRSSERMQAPSRQQYNHPDNPQNQTSAFSAVANERSFKPSHNSWGDNDPDFNFADTRASPLERAPKYISNRPRASGQSISAPGSSITRPSSASSHGIGDSVLSKVYMPAKKQDDFINTITRSNTLANRGPGNKMKLSAYSMSSSSLEIASAPARREVIASAPRREAIISAPARREAIASAPRREVIASAPARREVVKPSVGATRTPWINKKPPFNANLTRPKPRGLSTLTEKRLKSNNERRTSPPLVRSYELRDRSKTNLFGNSPTSTEPFLLRQPRSTKLGKRKTSEGSADKPIALDSDSDVEVQPDSVQTSKDIVEEVLNDTRKTRAKKDEEEKPPAEDLEAITVEAMMRIVNCDVMIGLFQCVVDLLVQGDRICMRNIRGKHEDWPFKGHYFLDFPNISDVRLYNVPKEVDLAAEIDAIEGDKMEQLLDEASYMAFKISLPKEEDQADMQSFYDPTCSDTPKGFMVLRPLEDASGGTVDDIRDHLRGQMDVHSIDDKEQAKEHLQLLTKDPFSYKSSQLSKRGKCNGADAESNSESEDDGNGSITVLAYPLPPCTSDVVTIIRSDVSRLKPRRYLNDNIIDYYFKRLMLESFRDNEIVQEKVLFLNSHFYTRLRAGKGLTARARMEAGYKNVSTWLARSNFFSRSIIFIPINKDIHWSLAVILNPGIAGNEGNDEAYSCIAVLDPLGSYHRKTAIIRNLRAFLRMEWGNSNGRSGKDDDYGVESVLTVNAKTPIQENSYDCGVYVLKFAEVILKSCLDQGLLAQNNGVIGKAVTDDDLESLITSTAFSAEDITATRKQIRQYIETDTIEYQTRKKEEKEKAKAPKD